MSPLLFVLRLLQVHRGLHEKSDRTIDRNCSEDSAHRGFTKNTKTTRGKSGRLRFSKTLLNVSPLRSAFEKAVVF